jgi:gliding motility-associated-like protein
MKHLLPIFLVFLLFTSCEKNEFEPKAVNIPDSTYFVYRPSPSNTSFCLYPYSYIILDLTVGIYPIYTPGEYQVLYGGTILTIYADTCSPPSFPPTDEMYVPNSFSPASDNHNDFFKPVPNLHVYNYALQIRDTEGILLYEEKKGDHLYFKGWDGTYQNTNMPTGFYLYYINYSTLTTENNILTGSLELIR